jgi:outer membrane autotransporter protein
MSNITKQLGRFKIRANPLNILVLGALYSSGIFSTQAIGETKDFTGQTVTDGVLINNAGDTVNINGGSKISNASDKNSVTIDLTSDPTKGATLNVSGQGTTISGGNIGIDVATSKGSVVNVTDNAQVDGQLHGIMFRNNVDGKSNATLKVENATVTGGKSAIYVWESTGSGSTVDISNSVIKTEKGVSGANALFISSGSTEVHVSNSSITSDARAILTNGDFSGIVDITDSTLTAVESGIRMTQNNGSTFKIANSTITSDDTGIMIGSSNKNTNITLSKGSTVKGSKNGIFGDSGGENNIINIDGSTVLSSAGNAVSLTGDYTLNVSAKSTIEGDNAIILKGDTTGSTVNVKDSTVIGKTNLLQISGTSAVDTVGFTGSTLSGAITTSSGADQSVNIDSSAWTGSAGKTGTGALALNISNGSTWINNAATDVDAISLTGGSTIVMDGGNIHTASLSDTAPTTLLAAASPTASTIYSTYNAETGSAFVLTADKATGSFNAGVTSSSSGAAGDMTGNTIVQVTDGSGATFNSMQSDVGVYRYESRSVANADGSTSVILDNITPEPTPDPAPGPNPNPDSRTLSTAAQAVVNTRAAAMSIWSDEQDVLNRRLDNERLTGSSDGTVNAWGSYYGGYHRQQVEQTSSAYDQTNNGFMLGADKRVDIAPGNLLFGFAATRGYSDVNMHDGGSAGTDVDSYGASLYTSLRLNNGLFFDASIKGTHLKNDISVTSLDGGHTTGDYNNNGFGGAFKTGYHKQFNAWYIEPYAQISYARYNSVDYKLKNGLHTKDDGSTSLGLEGGVNVGTAMALNNGTEVRPYVHLAVAGETENSNTMDINGEKINDSTDGSRGIVGLGADVKLSKNLSGWAGANYAKGQDHYESPWQLNAGVSYTW